MIETPDLTGSISVSDHKTNYMEAMPKKGTCGEVLVLERDLKKCFFIKFPFKCKRGTCAKLGRLVF